MSTSLSRRKYEWEVQEATNQDPDAEDNYTSATRQVDMHVETIQRYGAMERISEIIAENGVSEERPRRRWAYHINSMIKGARRRITALRKPEAFL